MNCICLIIGQSGSGKTTIVEQLETKYKLSSVKSYTTRKPRFKGETGHIFVSGENFDKLTDIIAYTEFAGNRYCATAEQVENNDLYVIDPKGIEFFLKAYKGNKIPKIIYIDSDISTRYERMVQRSKEKGNSHSDSVGMALSRIANDCGEFYDYIHHSAYVDYTIKNNADANLDFVVDKIYEYISTCESEVV